MSLQLQIQDDLRESMKMRDRERTSALRMILAAMKNAAIAAGDGPQGTLDDEAVQKLLATEIKRRREAADAFRDAGREEQAAKEEAEAAIYEHYLPQQLSDDELASVVDRFLAELDATGPADMGRVMKAVMPEVGPRADGSRVSAVVKDRLEALAGE